MRPKVIALVGPTCTGKTQLSLELAGKLAGEIVACDSRTVYRKMDIGTAKPSNQEQARIPHHMLDLIDPNQVYTAAQYKDDAAKQILAIGNRNKIAIVCGGTGFYARALLEGLQIPPVAPQIELRAELSQLAEREGNQSLHKKLLQLDPISAERINVNDRFRLIRALEVSLVLGQKFSDFAKRREPPYETIWIGLKLADANLHKAMIEARFQAQMSLGMLEETKSLLARYGLCQSLTNTVGYKQLVQFLAGNLSLPEAESAAIIHSYQLARRQLIWFRANPNVHWLNVDQLTGKQVFTQCLELLTELLANNRP